MSNIFQKNDTNIKKQQHNLMKYKKLPIFARFVARILSTLIKT